MSGFIVGFIIGIVILPVYSIFLIIGKSFLLGEKKDMPLFSIILGVVLIGGIPFATLVNTSHIENSWIGLSVGVLTCYVFFWRKVKTTNSKDVDKQ